MISHVLNLAPIAERGCGNPCANADICPQTNEGCRQADLLKKRLREHGKEEWAETCQSFVRVAALWLKPKRNTGPLNEPPALTSLPP